MQYTSENSDNITKPKEEIKSIKNKIKILRPLIKKYQKNIDDNQKQIDISVNKYRKSKKFICIGCCKKFYNQNDYDTHLKEHPYGCKRITHNSYPIYSLGVSDSDRTLYKYIREKKINEHHFESKQKELDKLLKQLEENANN